MELTPGYQQTVVGEIPIDWNVKHLGELGTVVRGGSPRPAGDPRYFRGDFIPWLTVAALTNISDHQLTVNETVSFLTEAGSKLSRMLTNGTLIIANSGATLGVAKLLGVTCCANDGIAAIINQRLGDKKYICFCINSQTERLREVVATGNGQPNLNTGLIREIAIPFPPPPEQTAISTALSDVDALLDGLDRLIAKKRDLKQAAMQQLLTGKTRLPGFEGEWEVKMFGELTSPGHSRIDPSRCEPHNFCVELEHIDQGSGSLLGWTETTLSSSLKATFNPGDVLFGKLRAYLRKYWLANREGVCSTEIWVLSSNEDAVTSGYLFQIVQMNWFIEAASTAYGTHMPRSDWKVVKELELRVPPVPEQTAIATVLSDMDAEIAALEQRRAKTKDIKQAMMQELLTGKTRLI